MNVREFQRIDAFELWCWRRPLRVSWTARRSNQSILKETRGVHWKDWCWSWNSNTLAIWCNELTHWKRLWCWEKSKAGGEGDDRGWDVWIASPTQWTWVCKLRKLVMDREDWHAAVHVVTKSQTWTSDWTEQNWTDLTYLKDLHLHVFIILQFSKQGHVCTWILNWNSTKRIKSSECLSCYLVKDGVKIYKPMITLHVKLKTIFIWIYIISNVHLSEIMTVLWKQKHKNISLENENHLMTWGHVTFITFFIIPTLSGKYSQELSHFLPNLNSLIWRRVVNIFILFLALFRIIEVLENCIYIVSEASNLLVLMNWFLMLNY